MLLLQQVQQKLLFQRLSRKGREVYCQIFSWTYSFREFVQVCIEGKKVVIVGRGLGAQDTVNYVEALLRKQGQSPDKLLLIIICNSLIVQDIDETARGPVPRNLIYFGQDIDTFCNHAFEDNGPDSSAFYLIEEFLRLRMQGGLICNEIPDNDVGIRKTSCWSFHGQPPPKPCLSSASWSLPA